jgi:lipid-binding SYLF domain-containing protein
MQTMMIPVSCLKQKKQKERKMKSKKSSYVVVSILAAVALLCGAFVASAQTAAEIDRDVDNGISKLYSDSPAAKELSTVAKGILVFPDVVKGGLIIGGQYGKGALRVNGKTEGYYNTAAASYGLQAGVQSFGYVMFFMTDSALKYLKESSGWEVGVGPSFVIVDEGKARSLTTTTAKDDIYVFFYGQKGLMAGLGIQGSKITKIEPDK